MTIAISEEIHFAEAVITRGQSCGTLELVVASLGIAEVDQRSILIFLILLDRVAEVDFELLIANVDIVIKVELNVVWPSDGCEIEKSEVFIDYAALSIISKGHGIPRHSLLI